MSTHRARANQSLYHAGILLSSWRLALQAADSPSRTLNEAFLPAVHLHLATAYGWFLLQVSGNDAWSGSPPTNTAQLPAVPEGKVISAEVREFAQLEKSGWLGQFLDALKQGAAAPVSRADAGLALAPLDTPGCDEALQWKRNFESLFERMSSAIDEC